MCSPIQKLLNLVLLGLFVLFCFVLRLHYMHITKSFAIGSRFILLPLWHPPGWGMGVKVTNLWSQHWLLKQPAQPTCNKTPLWLLRNEDHLGALSQELWRKTKYLFLTRNHKPPSLSSIWFRNFLWGRLNNTRFYANILYHAYLNVDVQYLILVAWVVVPTSTASRVMLIPHQ